VIPRVIFCDAPKTVDHIFFGCPIAKIIWGIVAFCFGQKCRPKTYNQFWEWIPKALQGGDKYYMFGLSVIRWAIWKCRNKVCFEKKLLKNPSVILHSACSFMCYWAGLHSTGSQEMINSGVDLMVKTAVKKHGKADNTTEDPGAEGGRSWQCRSRWSESLKCEYRQVLVAREIIWWLLCLAEGCVF
jgi:hypothetical protein